MHLEVRQRLAMSGGNILRGLKMKKKNSTISNNSKKSSFGSKLVLLLLIFAVSASSGFVFAIPVYDMANHSAQFQVLSMQESSNTQRFGIQERNRFAEYIDTMQQWAQQFRNYREQFQHARQVWDEVNDMRGNWRGTLTRLTDQEFVRAVLGEEGRDLVRLGWELRNGPRDIEVLPDQALDALERIEKTMEKKRNGGNFRQNGDPTLREDLQEVFGQVPGNRPDIENAHRTLARAASTISDINTAIDERRRNIEQWKQRIAAGGLVPGDLERLQLMINAEQQDISLLNARLGAINVEVQMAHTGLLTSGESDREISRARAENEAASFINGAGLLSPRRPEEQPQQRRR